MSSWPTTGKRPPGRHSSLLTDGEVANPELPADEGWLLPDAGIPGSGLVGAPGSGSDGGWGSGSDGGWGPGEAGKAYWASLEGGTRVSIRGQEPIAGGVGGVSGDTLVLGEPGLFRRPPPGIGLNRPVPTRPWYRRRGPVLSLALGLVLVAITGILATPPLLAALGVGAQTCPQCALPIPSTAAIGPGSPAMSVPASHPARPTSPARTVSASPSASAPVQVVPPPPTPSTPPPPPVTATYTSAVSGGNYFTGQVTVVNQSPAVISDWQLVVALPGDQVSSVQNAEFTDDNDVLFMRPAPYDLTIAPGASVTVTIYASGPVRTPAECAFNNVACR